MARVIYPPSASVPLPDLHTKLPPCRTGAPTDAPTDDVHGGNTKTEMFIALAEGLLAAGSPLDGVGIQLHINDKWAPYSEAAFAAVVERFGDLGLKVHVTELDIAPTCGAKCYGNATTVAEKEARQAAIYASALSVCLRAAHCEAFVFWEGTDAHPGGIKPPGMAIFDAAYRPKPAFRALERVLRAGRQEGEAG